MVDLKTKFCVVGNVNPGLINPGLLIRGVPFQ